jgi:hypothetical protein
MPPEVAMKVSEKSQIMDATAIQRALTRPSRGSPTRSSRKTRGRPIWSSSASGAEEWISRAACPSA